MQGGAAIQSGMSEECVWALFFFFTAIVLSVTNAELTLRRRSSRDSPVAARGSLVHSSLTAQPTLLKEGKPFVHEYTFDTYKCFVP